MKKFFLDHFYIKAIVWTKGSQARLQCVGNNEGQVFTFTLTLSATEMEVLLAGLKDSGKKIKRWLKKSILADMLELFKDLVVVDSCWLTIKVIELFEVQDDTDKEYCVENFGFIPEEVL